MHKYMNIIFYLFYNFSMRFFIIRLDQHPSQNITRFSFSQNVLSYFWCNYFHFTLRFRKCASFVHSPRLWILSNCFVLILGPKYFDTSDQIVSIHPDQNVLTIFVSNTYIESWFGKLNIYAQFAKENYAWRLDVV